MKVNNLGNLTFGVGSALPNRPDATATSPLKFKVTPNLRKRVEKERTLMAQLVNDEIKVDVPKGNVIDRILKKAAKIIDTVKNAIRR